MGINNILENALQAPWCLSDDFQFFYSNNLVQFQGVGGLQAGDSLDIAVISVDTPEVHI